VGDAIDVLSFVHAAEVGRAHGSAIAGALCAQFEAVLADGALRRKEKLLLLAATCFARRHFAPGRRAAALALESGATADELEEILDATYGSRGPLTYLAARSEVNELAGGAPAEPAAGPVASESMAESFRKYFGEVPAWVSLATERYPRLLDGTQMVREVVYRDGHVPRKLKELVFVSINCADRYEYGMDLHMKASLAAGATRDELLDAIAVAVLEGGMVAWIEGVGRLIKLEQSKA